MIDQCRRLRLDQRRVSQFAGEGLSQKAEATRAIEHRHIRTKPQGGLQHLFGGGRGSMLSVSVDHTVRPRGDA